MSGRGRREGRRLREKRKKSEGEGRLQKEMGFNRFWLRGILRRRERAALASLVSALKMGENGEMVMASGEKNERYQSGKGGLRRLREKRKKMKRGSV